MDRESCSRYYIEHKDEFAKEDGHKVLLNILKGCIGKQAAKTEKMVLALDIGACVGNYIKHLEAICPEPQAAILAFEPNPVNLEVLKKNVSSRRVTVYPYAVSNVCSKTPFYNWRDMRTNARGNENAALRGGGEKICDVDVVRLDTVLLQQCGPKEDVIIKYMKIDTEGNDTNVIKGLGEYIDCVQYMIFECSDCLDDHRGPGIPNPMKDIIDYLSARGFDTYRIGTRRLLKVNDEYWDDVYEKVKFWSNCFAIRKGDPVIHGIVDSGFKYLSGCAA